MESIVVVVERCASRGVCHEKRVLGLGNSIRWDQRTGVEISDRREPLPSKLAQGSGDPISERHDGSGLGSSGRR